jgi:hypothetical protein
METGESGVMSVSKLRNSTAIDRVLGITAVSDALAANEKSRANDEAQADKCPQDPPPMVS